MGNRLMVALLVVCVLLCGFVAFDLIERVVGPGKQVADSAVDAGTEAGASGAKEYWLFGKKGLTAKVTLDTMSSTFCDGLLLVSSQGKYGYLRKDGSYKLKPQFDDAADFHDGMAVICQDGLYGFATPDKVAITPKYEQAQAFQEGLAAVTVDDRVGFIDKKGEMVIKPQWDEVTNFAGGVALARNGSDWCAIDKTGARLYLLSKELPAKADLSCALSFAGAFVAVPVEKLEAKPGGQKVMVVYATKNIEEGEIIPQEALEERAVDAAKAPVDAFNSVNAVVGQQAAYPVPAGTIVSDHAVKPMAVCTGFEGQIKEGMRAFTLHPEQTSGASQCMEPGAHIDIYLSVGKGSALKQAAILSDAEVVAVGDVYVKAPHSPSFSLWGAAPRPNPNPDGITVAVTPKDSERLMQAVSLGRIYVTQRNDKDHEEIKTVDPRSLVAQEAK